MDVDRLVDMANQIARNFAVQGEDVAAAATARHIVDFWDPRMKSAIRGCAHPGLSPIAAKALAQVDAGS
ncbi:formate dehydrogenase subunit delta [Sphingomonas koreensis]